MKRIPLGHNLFALVDDEDFEAMGQLRWGTMRPSDHLVYAVRRSTDAELRGRKLVLMHREITAAPADTVVDHIDRNGLNNQRANLRVCVHGENICNSRLRVDNSTGIKGVSFRGGRSRPWVAQIGWKGKKLVVGSFASKEEAKEAYNAKARQLHGQFTNVTD